MQTTQRKTHAIAWELFKLKLALKCLECLLTSTHFLWFKGRFHTLTTVVLPVRYLHLSDDCYKKKITRVSGWRKSVSTPSDNAPDLPG